MMILRDFVAQVDGFDALSTRDKICLFGWFIHTYENKESFDNAAVRSCFERLHLVDPNVAKYLPRYADAQPPDFVRVKGGYKLERTVRAALDLKYGVHQSVVQISKLLADLPAKVPNLAEKAFLDEALKCYRVEAYR